MPELHTTNDGFNTTDQGLQPYNPDIAIDDKLLQALVRLLGFDAANKTWRALKTDQDGRLYVTTAPTQGLNVSQSVVSVLNTQTTILAANPSRRQMIIQNLGSAAIYLGLGNTVTTATGLQIPSNGIFIDERFLGAVYGISGTSGQDVRVAEY